MNCLKTTIFALAVSLGAITESRADIIVPGADGSDGSLTPSANLTIDLSLAANRSWDQPSPVSGQGVYDGTHWAVVFKYTNVLIPANVTVTFTNHPSNAPVVWIVSGTVQINGTVNLNAQGATNTPGVFAIPGPGGFRGGAYGPTPLSLPSAGFGPGGGSRTGYGTSGCYAPASYATVGFRSTNCSYPPTYGNKRILPLIGGSGGTPWDGGGGAGGGAILIACAKTITLGGVITANGSGGYSDMDGSGGAIRLVADRVADSASGMGRFFVVGDEGGVGRIRIEANTIQLAVASDPPYTLDSPGTTAVLWPSDLENAPSVRICRVGGTGQGCPQSGDVGFVGTDPRASLDFPGADVTVGNGGAQLVVIDAINVPLDWSVYVRKVPKQGPDAVIPAAFASGDASHSTWSATVPLGNGFSVLQARAYQPTATATANETEEGADTESGNVDPN